MDNTKNLIESNKSPQDIVRSLTDSVSQDIRFAISRAGQFNSGLLSLEETIELIVKDLGFEPNRRNLQTAEDHILGSSPRSTVITQDRDVYVELIKMLR